MEDQEPRQGLATERMQDTVFALTILRGDSARKARFQVIVEEFGRPDPTQPKPGNVKPESERTE
jgi:hypothetical protein